MAAHICSAVVVYCPDAALLATAVAAAAPQVETMLIIANDGGGWSCPLPDNTSIVTPDRNLGLGAAYNLAVRWARDHGATHLLLLDQDSVPAAGAIAALLDAFAQPGPVAAAGPRWRDSRTGQDGYFFRVTPFGARKYRPAPDEIAPVDLLISSGCLISLDALVAVGRFDETFFIEQVDFDWSMRARAKGYKLYGVAAARLDHAFGEATLATALGIRRRMYLHPPERNYYLLRNSMVLWRRPHAPRQWVYFDVLRASALMLFYALFVPPRLERLKQMARAVRDSRRLK